MLTQPQIEKYGFFLIKYKHRFAQNFRHYLATEQRFAFALEYRKMTQKHRKSGLGYLVHKQLIVNHKKFTSKNFARCFAKKIEGANSA